MRRFRERPPRLRQRGGCSIAIFLGLIESPRVRVGQLTVVISRVALLRQRGLGGGGTGGCGVAFLPEALRLGVPHARAFHRSTRHAAVGELETADVDVLDVLEPSPRLRQLLAQPRLLAIHW